MKWIMVNRSQIMIPVRPPFVPRPGSRIIQITAGRALIAFFGIVSIRVLTELLPPSEAARVYLFYATFGFFALVFINPVGMYFNRHLHEWNAHGQLQNRLLHLGVWVVAVVLISTVVLIFLHLFSIEPTKSHWLWSTSLIGLWLVVNTWHQTILPSLNLLGFVSWFVWGSVATVALSLAGATFLVRVVGAYAEAWLVGIIIGQILLLVLAIPAFLRRITAARVPPTTSLRGGLKVARFSIPLAVATGLMWAHFQGFRFSFSNQSDMASLGLFLVGYSVSAGILGIYEAIITQNLQPSFYRGVADAADGQDVHKAWNAYAGAIIPTVVVTVAFVVAVAPLLAEVLLAEEYQSAVQFVMWGAVVEGLRVTFQAFAFAMHADTRTVMLLPSHALGALIAVGGTFSLVPLYGGHGAGIALVVATAAAVTALWLTVRVKLGLRVGWVKPMKGFVASLPLLAIASILQFSGVAHQGLVYSLLLGLAAAVYVVLQYILLFPRFRHYRGLMA